MSVYTNNTLNKEEENNAWTKIFNFVKPNAKVLDIGCSSGRLGAALKKAKQVTVVGVDIDEEDVKLAKENLDEAFVLNFEKDDLSKLGKFDVVVIADVIEHLLKPVEALSKVKSVLNPGGYIVFSIPNMANGINRLELLKGRFEYTDWGLLDRTHLHYYDKVEVESVFDNAGFEVKEMDCTIKDIPTKIIKEELNKLGLTPSEDFISLMHSPEVITFQFIGCAVPGLKKVGFKVASKTPLDVVDKEIAEIKSSYEKTLFDLRNDLSEKDRLYKEVKERLDSILNSKSWALVEKSYNLRRKVKSIKRSKEE